MRAIKKVLIGVLVLALSVFALVYIIIFFVLSAQYEKYGFSNEVAEFKRGIVQARFSGKLYTEVKWDGQYATSRSPYNLLVTITDPVRSGRLKGVVHINKLYLTDKETGKVLYEKTDVPGVQVVGGYGTDGKYISEKFDYDRGSIVYYKGNYKALYLFKKIDLEHKEADLYVEFSVVDGDKKTYHKVKLSFETEYKPRHRSATLK